MVRSDNFEEYVGQLQMATIASIQVEHGGTREMGHKEITDKLRPLQQVKPKSAPACHLPPCAHLS
jgi:hypothetical protein